MRHRILVGFALAWTAAATFCAGAAAQTGGDQRPTCPNGQTPRRLEHAGGNATFSVQPTAKSDTISYKRLSDGREFLLHRCGQHFHCRVENVQPDCAGQQGSPGGACPTLTPGSWVEIHTVFSTKVGTTACDPQCTGCQPGKPCDPEGLCCCQSLAPGDPVLVLAYHAKVTDAGPPLAPIALPWGSASMLWSGSTTGENPPERCKGPAQWDFVLGCGFTVSMKQLALFHHIDRSRPLQTYLSPDLVYVPAPPLAARPPS